jgi:tetratricopeptide (TPR) repeat protein
MPGYFVICKPWHDWIISLQLGLAAARDIGDRTGEAWMLGLLGYAYRVRCPEEAVICCHQALAVFGELGDRIIQATVLSNLGLAYHELRRSEEALGCCQQALVISRELGDRPNQANCLTAMSVILRGLRRSEEATGYCDQALVIFRELGDRWGQGVAERRSPGQRRPPPIRRGLATTRILSVTNAPSTSAHSQPSSLLSAGYIERPRADGSRNVDAALPPIGALLQVTTG